MILLLGNNENFRHNVLLSLFMKKYCVAEHSIEECEYLTKPFLTVYINPTIEQIHKIKHENTITVVAKNDLRCSVPEWIRVIPYGQDTVNSIINIYEENCTFAKEIESFGIISLEDNKIAIGGAYIRMTTKQLNAVKILLYNKDKLFSSYDISSYFGNTSDAIVSFELMVQEINFQCKRAGREKLICYENDKYFISPEMLDY